MLLIDPAHLLGNASNGCEIAATAILHPGIELEKGVYVGDYALIGVPARGQKAGDAGTRVGEGSSIAGHAVIHAGTCIGKQVHIGTHAVIEANVRIADNVEIHCQAFIPEGSVLEEGCWIGPSVVLTNAKYPAAEATERAGVIVGRRAKIGANATILAGIRLGKDCLVGAGAVVTQDVPAGAVVIGNPARVTKTAADLLNNQTRKRTPLSGQRRPTEVVRLRAAG